MADKKAPVIVVKKSRLNAAALLSPLPESRADARTTTTNAVSLASFVPVAPVPENSSPPTRKPFNKQARRTREKITHFSRTFPALWPDFEKGKYRPMKVGIKEQVREYIEAHPDCGMTFGQWIVAVRLVISRIEYQRCVKEGKTRYDIHGEPAGEVTAREAAYARLQVSRIKARLDARANAQVKQTDVPDE